MIETIIGEDIYGWKKVRTKDGTTVIANIKVKAGDKICYDLCDQGCFYNMPCNHTVNREYKAQTLEIISFQDENGNDIMIDDNEPIYPNDKSLNMSYNINKPTTAPDYDPIKVGGLYFYLGKYHLK